MGLKGFFGLNKSKKLDRFLEDPSALEAERTPMEDIRDALAYMVAKMVLADGVVQAAERKMAKSIFQSSSLFFHLEDDEYDAYLDETIAQVKAGDPQTEKVAVEILRQGEWDFTALAMMTDLMISDGRIHPDELAALRKMAKAFGIRQDQVNAMVNTFRARRRNWGDPPLGASDGSAQQHHRQVLDETVGPRPQPHKETRSWFGNRKDTAAPAVAAAGVAGAIADESSEMGSGAPGGGEDFEPGAPQQRSDVG